MEKEKERFITATEAGDSGADVISDASEERKEYNLLKHI